jgi:hypothetical protein
VLYRSLEHDGARELIIDLSTFPKGIYLLKIGDQHKIQTEKLILK